MNNPNIKLIIKIANPNNSLAQFTLHKGAQLDASIISPKRLIEMQNGILKEPDLEEKVNNQILKSVMGECTQDIKGKCTIEEAIELIRALNHKQEVKLALCEEDKKV